MPAILLTAAVAGLGGFGLWRATRTTAAPATGTPAAASETTAPASAAQASPDFQKLRGRWVRPDGGYVLDVRNVEDGGRMDVSYFNPRPIHVANAAAWRDGAATKVFIELRDANYPGSTYNLAYNRQQDQLEGIYYQAALKESFEVVFLRTN